MKRCFLIIFVIFILCNLSGCNEKESLLPIHDKLSKKFEFANFVKELDKTDPETYHTIQAQLAKAKEEIDLNQFDRARERLMTIAEALRPFIIHKAVELYYLDSSLHYLTINTNKNASIESITQKEQKIIQEPSSISTASIKEKFQDLEDRLNNSGTKGTSIGIRPISVKSQIAPSVNTRISITYTELNILDNVAKAIDELCPHISLERIALLEDENGKYIYVYTKGKRILNSKASNPLIRTTSYLVDDFGRLFTRIPPTYQGYVIDIYSQFQDLDAEIERKRNFEYWDRQRVVRTKNALIAMIEQAKINEQKAQYTTPYPVNSETSRVIIASSSLEKFHKDGITVSQLFAECKLYLRGVRSDIDMTKTIDLSQ